MPIDLKLQLINEIKRIKIENLSKREIRGRCQADTQETIQKWNERYVNCGISGHVRRLIPSVYERLDMGKELPINYYNPQAFREHGKRAENLRRFKVTENKICRDCNREIDSMVHAIPT